MTAQYTHEVRTQIRKATGALAGMLLWEDYKVPSANQAKEDVLLHSTRADVVVSFASPLGAKSVTAMAWGTAS